MDTAVPESPQSILTTSCPAEPASQTGEATAEGASTLLIVEDNADVAQLIAQQLEGRYVVHFATNGSEGIQKALELIPDIVITDLMMPETDGLQLCRTLRENPATNHIPLIVITARATETDRIQGLRAGADAYLYKPFNREELNVRIEKLLSLRQLLRRKYSTEDVEKETTLASTKQDKIIDHITENMEEESVRAAFADVSETFIQQVRETVIRLMPQGNCDIESIADELCITPSQLRRKMNAITGIPPKKFIMQIRMNKARQMLLKQPELKLTVIAEKCGFYDHSHFIRLYKETYGITPAADRKRV
jgi:DNA-binding response OmpR family regulator